MNIIAALIMHRVSNKLLMAIGALSWAGSSALMSAMNENSSYWAFVFPALVLSVVGADFEFTVTNMYVMSSLPREQQSVAGGLFNTVTRLSTNVGLGVSTAVFTSFGGPGSGGMQMHFRPYQSTFWVSMVGAGLGLFCLPFLTIKSQGAQKRKKLDEEKLER